MLRNTRAHTHTHIHTRTVTQASLHTNTHGSSSTTVPFYYFTILLFYYLLAMLLCCETLSSSGFSPDNDSTNSSGPQLFSGIVMMLRAIKISPRPHPKNPSQSPHPKPQHKVFWNEQDGRTDEHRTEGCGNRMTVESRRITSNGVESS